MNLSRIIAENDHTVDEQADNREHFNRVVATLLRKIDGMDSFLGKETPFRAVCVDRLGCDPAVFDSASEKAHELAALLSELHTSVSDTHAQKHHE